MRLKQLLTLLLVSIALGAGGLLVFNNRPFRRITSLSPEQIGGYDEIDVNSQEEVVFSPIPLSQLTSLQDPFFQSPCYLSTHGACVLIVKKQDGVSTFSFQNEPDFNLTSDSVQFGMGRILGKPDNLKFLFQQQVRTNKYNSFVRSLEKESLENGLNPEVVYVFLDYAVGQQRRLNHKLQMPHLEGIVLSLKNELNQPADTDQANPNWSPEGRALISVASTYFADLSLLQEMFKDTGALDEYYQSRIQSLFVERSFSPRWTEIKLVENAYFRGDFSAEIAACHGGKAYLCAAPSETPSEAGFEPSTCLLAPFLDEFCEGTLPVL